MHRFFAPSLDPGDEVTTLPRNESEHLTRVLRLGPGDQISVFDGRGHEYTARVGAAHGREVRVEIVARIDPPHEFPVTLTLVQAVLKGEKMDDVVRDAVMLGVSAIQPVISARSEVTVASLLRGHRLERWKRVALASTKQSRRAVLTEIRTPLPLETWFDEPGSSMRLMLVEPEAGAAGTSVEPFSALRGDRVPGDAAILVGPEGGWSEAECSAAREKGVRLMTLGPRTLRADAVPVAAISVLNFLWG